MDAAGVSIKQNKNDSKSQDFLESANVEVSLPSENINNYPTKSEKGNFFSIYLGIHLFFNSSY